MADEAEKKLDAPKIQPPSDALAKPSVIRTNEDEAVWSKMQEPHKLGEHESATHIGLTPEVIAEMQRKGQASKLEFFDSKAEEAKEALQKPQTDQTLIASNVTPSLANLEQKAEYVDVQADSTAPAPEAIMAQNLGDKVRQGYRGVRNQALGIDIVRMTTLPDIGHPLAGKERDIIGRIPETAWKEAADLFPVLEANGLTQQQSTLLIKSILANEIRHYDFFDQADDMSVHMTGSPIAMEGRPVDDATLGYAQISVNGVRRRSQEFPQIKDYLEKHGYPPGQELKALTDPKIAPILIAGTMAHTAKMYENHNIPITELSLAYGFNPDISFSRDDREHVKPLTPKAVRHLEREGKHAEKELLPTEAVLKASPHVNNIRRWLDWISKNDNG